MHQKFMPVVEYKEVKAELLPAFLKLAKDDQDSVRLLTVDACVTLANLFKQNNAVLPPLSLRSVGLPLTLCEADCAVFVVCAMV